MYANHATSRSTRAVSLGGALLLNGAILGGLILAAPQVIPGLKPPPTEVILIPETPPPPPIPDTPPPDQPERAMDHPIVTPDPRVDPQVDNDNPVRGTTEATDHPITRDIPTGGDDLVNRDHPPPIPPLLAAQVDPRFADALQPPYPASEIRLQREGRVSVRVLIGTDGRVKAVEQVSATSPAFYEATRRQAIARWRFKPATRGGNPEESWKTMTLRFELTGQ